MHTEGKDNTILGRTIDRGITIVSVRATEEEAKRAGKLAPTGCRRKQMAEQFHALRTTIHKVFVVKQPTNVPVVERVHVEDVQVAELAHEEVQAITCPYVVAETDATPLLRPSLLLLLLLMYRLRSLLLLLRLSHLCTRSQSSLEDQKTDQCLHSMSTM